MKKLIYLEDAIEAIKDADVLVFYDTGTDTDDACELAIRATKGTVIESLNVLPSAEPEIIRCRECKHYRMSELFPTNMCCHYVIGTTVVKNPNDFCSRAERRTDEAD